MHHRHVKQAGYTLIEVALAVAVGATLLATGVSIQSRITQVSGLSAAKAQVRAIASAMEMYYQKNGYYPNSGNGTAGVHLGTTVYSALSNYLDSNFQTTNAYTGVSYTPKTWIFTGANRPEQWWTDVSAYAGEILIVVRNSTSPTGNDLVASYSFEGPQQGTDSPWKSNFYSVQLMDTNGRINYEVSR